MVIHLKHTYLKGRTLTSYFKLSIFAFSILIYSKAHCDAKVPDAFENMISFYNEGYKRNELSTLAKILWSADNFKSRNLILSGEFADIFLACDKEPDNCHQLLESSNPEKIHLYYSDDTQLPWFVTQENKKRGFEYEFIDIEEADLNPSELSCFPIIQLDQFSDEPGIDCEYNAFVFFGFA